MIVVRSLVHGVRQHFTIRLSEWLMLYPAVGMWVALQFLQPDMFSSSKSFAQVAMWADEKTWATLVLFCAVARLIAFVVNGTFDEFRYSPLIRTMASLIGLLFWSQFSLGFLQAYVAIEGSFSAVIAYSTFVVAEIANVYRSTRDMGSTYADVKRRHERNGLGL